MILNRFLLANCYFNLFAINLVNVQDWICSHFNYFLKGSWNLN